MASWTAFLWTYLLGGVTFIPLVIVAILLHAHYTFPYRDDVNQNPASTDDDLVQPGDDVTTLEAFKREKSDKKDKAQVNHDASDQSAGYFAVCREYTPMGINAKPIERNTPVGSTTVASPSPSVYQTMYRSIFDRKQPQNPIDTSNNMSQRPKKAGNVFYVVLRHGHLVLFDDEEQAEVRHVISLLHHDVAIYSGGDETPEGELFIKRNAICLSRKKDAPDAAPGAHTARPFYLFSENCSAKEDFYFALLRNQDQVLGGETKAPRPLQFDPKHIISLVQKLYASEDNMNTRWLNAIIGRIFLAIYQTADVEQLIREKITKKISRVKRPSFLTKIIIRKIELGDSAPFITNPRLKDLTVQGECVTEADFKYTGNFRIEIATTARIDLGQRFSREVSLVLAVVVKKVEGHVLLKVKPPPSNRLWVSFSHMPKLDMTIEPIVSSRQITYSMILKQIENRIREVVAETMVLPFWDDTPFFRTEHKKWRGGIWEDDNAVIPAPYLESAITQEADVEEMDKLEHANGSGEASAAETWTKEKSQSAPVLETTSPSSNSGLFGRRHTGQSILSTKANASSSSVDAKQTAAGSPRTFHAPPYSGTSSPVVNLDTTNADVFKPGTPPKSHDAASAMANISVRSQQVSPTRTAHGSPSQPASLDKPSSIHSGSSKEADLEETPVAPSRADTTMTSGTTATVSSTSTASTDGPAPTSPMSSSKFSLSSNTSLARGLFSRKDDSQASLASTGTHSSAVSRETKRTTALAAVSNAAMQARQWGLNALKRNDSKGPHDSEGHSIDLNQPMGRGRPLPPPGVPLPMPDRKTPTAPIPVPKRKLAPPPVLPNHEDSGSHGHDQTDWAGTEGVSSNNNGNIDGQDSIPRRPVPPPPLPRRRQLERDASTDGMEETMLVVAAPQCSEPGTPLSPPSPQILMDGESWDNMVAGTESQGPEITSTPSIEDTPRAVAIVSTGDDIGIDTVGKQATGDVDRSLAEDTAEESSDVKKKTPPPLPQRDTHKEKPEHAQEITPPKLPPRTGSLKATSEGKAVGGNGRTAANPIVMAVADDDDDYSGWMNNAEFEGIDAEAPSPAALTPPTPLLRAVFEAS